MFNQHRIYRIFQLINYLKASPPKTYLSLAKMLGVTGRSIYRYLDLLEELGLKVEKDAHGKYFIPTLDSTDHMAFTSQEADFMTKLIQSVGSGNPLSDSVLSKISNNSEVQLGAHTFYKAHLAEIVEDLSYAILHKKQVILQGYYSASSQTVSDRLVEPMCFTENYESISAFEIASEVNKYFNIERISKVEVLEADMKFESSHKFYMPDIFGFQGKHAPLEVEWEMSLRASLLLKEEYPMSRSAITPIPNSDRYHFKATVYSYKGPGRFVMGFLDEINLVGSDKFRRYLKKLMSGKQDEN